MARILIIAYTNYYQDPRVKRNAEALAQRGDHVDVISLAYGSPAHSRGVHIIALPIARYRGGSNRSYIGSYLRFFVMASIRATRLSRRQPYDIVIVCTMPDAAVICALGPKLYGARVLLDVHDTMPELYQEKFKGIRGALGSRLLMVEERASAWLADGVLAVHEPHRQRLTRAGVPASKVSVVMNLPDRRLFGPPPVGQDKLLTGSSADNNGYHTSAGPHGSVHACAAQDVDVFRLVCHGTVTLRLGLDLAIHALALVRGTIPSIHLEVIGEGDFLPAVKELTRKLHLQEHVTFTPPKAVEELPAALARAGAGIVPNRASRATHLMLPAKLLEYAALGVPVITARLQTVEYYFPTDSVRYFEPGDVYGLAGAIEDLHRHPENRLRLGRRAAEVVANLNWDHQRFQLFETIDSLLTVDEESRKTVPMPVHHGNP